MQTHHSLSAIYSIKIFHFYAKVICIVLNAVLRGKIVIEKCGLFSFFLYFFLFACLFLLFWMHVIIKIPMGYLEVFPFTWKSENIK